jgi:hypothetical protein
MYLNRLDKEKQELFLELALHAAWEGEDFAREEKQLIDIYCSEMNLPKSDYKKKMKLEEVLERLREKCSKTEKNIILIEITALVMCDEVYDSGEQEFMQKVIDVFGFDDDKLQKTMAAVRELTKCYAALNEIVQD